MQYEIWQKQRYLFTCFIGEDPYTAVGRVQNGHIVKIENGQRTILRPRAVLTQVDFSVENHDYDFDADFDTEAA